MTDIVNGFFSHASNSILKGKFEVTFSPINELLINILEKLKQYGYVIDYEILSRERGGEVRVIFSEFFNKGNTIKPRFPVGYREFEKYEKRFLPARGFGILLVSTSKGIKTNEECKREKIGGILIAYVY